VSESHSSAGRTFDL